MIHYLVKITVQARTKEGFSLADGKKTYVVDAVDDTQAIGMDIMRLVLSHNCLVTVVNLPPQGEKLPKVYNEDEFYDAALGDLT